MRRRGHNRASIHRAPEARGLPSHLRTVFVAGSGRRGRGEWSDNPRGAEEVGEDGDGFTMLLASGAEDGHQAPLMASAVPGSVAAPDLAVDHRWAERLLGHPIRGWHP